MDSIAKIFEVAPQQWGLRGDPYLWAELQASLIDLKADIEIQEFNDALQKKFDEIIKRDGVQNSDNIISFSKYPKTGMSGGAVSLKWWMETGLPLLKRRFAELSHI